jgi:hypothetical protein
MSNLINVNVNRFDGTTTWRSENVGIKRELSQNVNGWVFASVSEGNAKPAHAIVCLQRNATEWHFLENHDTILLIDGQRMIPERAWLGDHKVESVGDFIVIEVVALAFAPAELEMLSNASSIEARIGTLEFDLMPFVPSLKALKDVAFQNA